MDRCFIILLLIFLLIGCHNAKNSKHLEHQNQSFDTIIVDFDKMENDKSLIDSIWNDMKWAELMDSLQRKNIRRNVIDFRDSEKLFGEPSEISQFYTNNIPKSLYRKFFPLETIKTFKRKIVDTLIDTTSNKIFIQKGTLEQEERGFPHLYSFIEKERFLMFFFTKQGKFYPEIEMVTASKASFELISTLKIYGGIYDSYDIDYWFSELSDSFDSIKLTTIKNLEFNDIRLDTTVVFYSINDRGKILRI